MDTEMLEQALAVHALASIVSERWNTDQSDRRDAHLVHIAFLLAEQFCYLNRTGVEDLDHAAGMAYVALKGHLDAGEEWRAANDKAATDAAADKAGASLIVAAENAAKLVAGIERQLHG